MNRFPLLLCALAAAATISAASGSPAQTAPASATSTDPLAANAALFYWRSFVLLPNLNETQEKALDAALKDGPADEQTAEVVRLSEPVLRELHRATRQPRCVWGTPTEDGIFTLLPHAGKARMAAKLAVARAHWNFLHGKPAEGVDDLIAAMTLARRIGGEKILITLLVDYAIESQAEQVAAVDLPRMGPAELKQFAAKLDQLPRAITMREAILEDKRMFLGSALRELASPGGKERLLNAFDNPNDPTLKVFKELSQEQLREGLLGLEPVYEKVAAMTELSPSEIKNAEERLRADPNLKGPARTLAQLLLPPIMPATQNEAIFRLRLALLKAAIAVQEQGPEALSRPANQDPFTKTPFAYEKTGGGFRLESKTANPKTGKPIVLETGKGLSG